MPALRHPPERECDLSVSGALLDLEELVEIRLAGAHPRGVPWSPASNQRQLAAGSDEWALHMKSPSGMRA
jgi:hypothetical protein